MTQDIVFLIVEVGALLAAITIIWNFSNRIEKSLDKKIDEKVVTKIKENDEKVAKDIEHAIDKSNISLIGEIKLLNQRFESHYEQQDKLHESERKRVSLLTHSVLEAYKRSIRDVYYRLRQTGEISDVDMSYVDKIYPKYVDMGGNSDIRAKYEEMKGVYSQLTQERYEKAREKAREQEE